MLLNRFFTLVLIVITIMVSSVTSHSRWTCPPPRNPSTGIKTGPCGAETGNFNGVPLNIQPGPLTVQWEESIGHTGAPWRISLSGDMDDSTSCLLLDHIPHNDLSSPTYMVPSTYVLYQMTIEIPDVHCERCSLHFANPMTDKIGANGAPSGSGCTDPSGTCFSVYHSCTVPLRINGTTSRSNYVCPGQPNDWPTTWVGDNGAAVIANVSGVYRREASNWVNGVLTTVPAKYTTPGNNCNPAPPPSSSTASSSSPTTASSPSPTTVSSKLVSPPTVSVSTSSPTPVPSSASNIYNIGIITIITITISWM